MSDVKIHLMREAIREVYPGPKWSEKVNKMAPNQVMAVYYSFKKRGKIA